MNTCKNCKFWGIYRESVCDLIESDDIGKEIGSSAYVHAYASDDYGLEAYLVTGPDFGCTLFKERTQTNE